jgi:hypothetical protein
MKSQSGRMVPYRRPIEFDTSVVLASTSPYESLPAPLVAIFILFRSRIMRAVLCVFIFTFLLVGCQGKEGISVGNQSISNASAPTQVAADNNKEESEEWEIEDASSDKPYIYRHLVSVSNYTGSLDEAWRLCLDSKDFNEELPTAKVVMSREIRIPAAKTSYTEREFTNYDTVVVKKKQEMYGIEVEPISEEIRIPRKSLRTVEVTSKALCIGSEYILTEKRRAD